MTEPRETAFSGVGFASKRYRDVALANFARRLAPIERLVEESKPALPRRSAGHGVFGALFSIVPTFPDGRHRARNAVTHSRSSSSSCRFGCAQTAPGSPRQSP